jgi:hypothetical protein
MAEEYLKDVCITPTIYVGKKKYDSAKLFKKETESDLEIIAKVGIVTLSLFNVLKSEPDSKLEFEEYIKNIKAHLSGDCLHTATPRFYLK